MGILILLKYGKFGATDFRGKALNGHAAHKTGSSCKGGDNRTNVPDDLKLYHLVTHEPSRY
jgi:hypothetical protein